MCGRISLLTYDELEEVVAAIEARRASRIDAKHDARAQARPGGEVSAIVGENGAGGNLRLLPFTWGFLAPWGNRLIFNTRIESALGGVQMWQDALRDGRCVVPVATFFEPHGSETERNLRTGRQAKRQYEFASPIGEPLLLAGIQHKDRLSIVTTEPNAHVSPIHPRMPLVLRFDEVFTWFDGDFASLADRSAIPLQARPEQGSTASASGGPSTSDNPQLSLL